MRSACTACASVQRADPEQLQNVQTAATNKLVRKAEAKARRQAMIDQSSSWL